VSAKHGSTLSFWERYVRDSSEHVILRLIYHVVQAMRDRGRLPIPTTNAPESHTAMPETAEKTNMGSRSKGGNVTTPAYNPTAVHEE
jgi:hypothetical protein